MSGPISFEFATTVAGVVGVAVAIAVWVIQVFQTKSEAAESEKRMQKAFDAEISAIKRSVDDVHKHLESVRTDQKEQFVNVRGEMSTLRSGSETMSRDVSYIRGLLEPRSSAGVG